MMKKVLLGWQCSKLSLRSNLLFGDQMENEAAGKFDVHEDLSGSVKERVVHGAREHIHTELVHECGDTSDRRIVVQPFLSSDHLSDGIKPSNPG